MKIVRTEIDVLVGCGSDLKGTKQVYPRGKKTSFELEAVLAVDMLE